MRLLVFMVFTGMVFQSFSQSNKDEIHFFIVHDDSSVKINLCPPSNIGDSLTWKIQGISGIITEKRPIIALPDTGKFKIELFVNTKSQQNYYSTYLILKNDSLSKIKPQAFQCGYGCGTGYDLCFKSNGMKNFKATIFNRWGELVFESGEPEITWEKKHYKTGMLLSAGTYFYIMEWTDNSGNHHRQTDYWTYVR